MTTPAVRRWARLAAALALGAGGAQAQNVERLPPARSEVGLYTGGSVTTDWFRTADAGWSPGYAPTFGALGHLWLTPRLGVRLHGAYLPQNLPGAGGLDQRLRVVNGYLYDAGLAFRPFVLSTPNTLLQSVYLFAGGGAFTANVGDFLAARDDGARCVEHDAWTPGGVCVSTRAGYATSAMGTAGGGIRLGPVTRRVEAFGELAVHAYASPGHVRGGAGGEDRLAWTPRAVFGLRVPVRLPAVNDPARRGSPGTAPLPSEPAARPAPTVSLDPAAPAAPVSPVSPATRGAPAPSDLPASPTAPGENRGAAPATVRIQVCRVHEGAVVRVEAELNAVTGDSTVAGVPLRTAFPESPGALGTEWYADGEPLVIGGRRYVKFGLPGVLEAGSVQRIGERRGVSVFADKRRSPGTVYVPLGAGCEFQAYVAESRIGAVRG